MQNYVFQGTVHRHQTPLSNENAVGLIMANGILGEHLDGHHRPAVYLSTDAGFNWQEVCL